MSVFELNVPYSITFGIGSIKKINEIVSKHGSRALIIANANDLAYSSVINDIKNILIENLMHVIVYDDITEESTSEAADMIEQLL